MCEAALANAVAQLKQLVDSTTSAPGNALDLITFRLHAQEVRSWHACQLKFHAKVSVVDVQQGRLVFTYARMCSSTYTRMHLESDAQYMLLSICRGYSGLNACGLQGRLLRELQSFVYTGQPGYLPSFAQRAQDFQESVHTLVYDVLMLKVSPRKALQALLIAVLVLIAHKFLPLSFTGACNPLQLFSCEALGLVPDPRKSYNVSCKLPALQLPSTVQVHGSLEGLGSQPVWQQEDPSGSAGGALPSFSAYPQQSVTAAGEYLMMMPQTLEGLLGSGDDAEDQMDSEWLDKVAILLFVQHEYIRADMCTESSVYCARKTMTHACLQGARPLLLY